jgi:hypothetical protein
LGLRVERAGTGSHLNLSEVFSKQLRQKPPRRPTISRRCVKPQQPAFNPFLKNSVSPPGHSSLQGYPACLAGNPNAICEVWDGAGKVSVTKTRPPSATCMCLLTCVSACIGTSAKTMAVSKNRTTFFKPRLTTVVSGCIKGIHFWRLTTPARCKIYVEVCWFFSGPVAQNGQGGGLLSRRSWVQVPPGPYFIRFTEDN